MDNSSPEMPELEYLLNDGTEAAINSSPSNQSRSSFEAQLEKQFSERIKNHCTVEKSRSDCIDGETHLTQSNDQTKNLDLGIKLIGAEIRIDQFPFSDRLITLDPETVETLKTKSNINWRESPTSGRDSIAKNITTPDSNSQTNSAIIRKRRIFDDIIPLDSDDDEISGLVEELVGF
jgi:hypothetical protein